MTDFKYGFLFPEGKKRALTFSYDDGMIFDRRLVDIFDRYHLKATFHLNSGRLGMSGEEEYVKEDEIEDLYEGHEVSGHMVNHPYPLQLNGMRLLNEALEDRRKLEELSGYIIRSMSYPYGDFSDDMITVLKAAGIEYSRTVNSTGSFSLPADFLKWNPTCHHNDAHRYVDRFLNPYGYEELMLFYIWGHSFEFDRENTWDMMEGLCKKLSGNDDIWYATGIEIKDYVSAMRSLISNVEETVLYNPSAITLYIGINGEVRTILPGEKIRL